MQVVAEAVALGSTLDLLRDLLLTHRPRLLSSLRLISESWLYRKECFSGGFRAYFRWPSARGDELIDLARVNLSANESQIGQLD